MLQQRDFFTVHLAHYEVRLIIEAVSSTLMSFCIFLPTSIVEDPNILVQYLHRYNSGLLHSRGRRSCSTQPPLCFAIVCVLRLPQNQNWFCGDCSSLGRFPDWWGHRGRLRGHRSGFTRGRLPHGYLLPFVPGSLIRVLAPIPLLGRNFRGH